ncbi:MAG: large subunit ribosomal protein L32 [Flavobacteriales bacterium]|mgnify:CR=1 FL=1|jgi:large subunit ribosomal protein L32|tara:strand:+ start:9365 stop:9538 length:174 start_codon:yes stop_codon:yes gene_type:complete
MAVPKKRTSKSKKNSRNTTWRQKPAKEALKAISLAKSVLSGNGTTFKYPQKEQQSLS